MLAQPRPIRKRSFKVKCARSGWATARCSAARAFSRHKAICAGVASVGGYPGRQPVSHLVDCSGREPRTLLDELGVHLETST
jgi:hypothetical protein